MKEQFRKEKISVKKLVYIDTINIILKEYEEMGYTLTLRQLYYQLVARDFIPNHAREYSKLSGILVTARMNGLVDWDMIEDRVRRPELPYWVRGIKHAIDDTIGAYRLDRQKGQKNYIEIWTEKDAVSNILKRVSYYHHIRLMVNRGYSSCSAMKNAYDRISWRTGGMLSGQNPVIIYVGDHDPSGLDMIRDIEERLEEFGLCSLTVNHIALTSNQIDDYNPPPNPTKITDPRAKWYIEKFGESSWELDALRPDVLQEIVTNAVEELIDLDLFASVLKQEKVDKEKLASFAEDFEK